MDLDPVQRAYEAPCPGCGAPVAFRSAQSAFAICAYCQSTVARSGETLQRIGKMAELFEDFSPLQLMTAGRFDGTPFTLVGRLQYQYPEGRWTEWCALLDDGRTATLAEDNGAYVFSRPVQPAPPVPAAATWRVGATATLLGKRLTVTSHQQVQLVSAQGELPHLPALGQPFPMVELRSDVGEVLALDYGGAAPALSLGRAVALAELQLTGLRQQTAKQETGRQFDCPQCGAPITLRLEASKSVVCASCNSIVDTSQGIGGELRHALQDEPVRPLIALGRTGTLMGVDWQVVGFQHRMGTDSADPDEQFGWNEYLLYNRLRGFQFLVDATDGWSLVAPATGTPTIGSDRRYATLRGTRYALRERYTAETTYVAGEFYWQVRRGQKTQNSDYASGNNLLSLEQGANELTWSVGSHVASDQVASAFKLDDSKALLRSRDAKPLSAGKGVGCATIVLVVLVVLVLLVILSTCSSTGSGGTGRSSGGSYGGFSTGGGHK